MIDSHTHLTSCRPPAEELVAAAAEAGVQKLVSVAQTEDDAVAVLELADRFPGVHAAVGRHPTNATGYDDATTAALRTLAMHPKCVAIGETGFDFFHDRSSREDQERAFLAQIGLARELGKPLVIHTRDADEATLATLDEHAAGLDVVLHCFSMASRVEACVERGWWISFAGNVTYPKNEDLAEAARQVPLDRLLVETDAPYLTPQVVRKERNQPAYVAHTARFVAERRGLAYDELDAAVERNAAALFGW